MTPKRIHLVFVLFIVFFASAVFAGEPRLVLVDNSMVRDTKTGLVWQLAKSPEEFDTKEKAAQYAASLDLGGYHDWRLPSLEERWDLLQVFVLKNNGGIEFPHCDNKYWTTGTDKETQPIKLGITCMCRGDQEVEYKKTGYVRAVRGGQTGNQ